MLASGLSLIFGLMSVLNFAHGGLFAWGAFTGVWLFNMTGSYILALVGAVAMGMFLGFILERFLIRRYMEIMFDSCSLRLEECSFLVSVLKYFGAKPY